MKLRLQGDSVRLRLSRVEVATLATGADVEAVTRFFSGGELRVQLTPGDQWHTSLESGTLRIAAPGLTAWAATDAEGLYHLNAIAIEKDFACLHRDPTANEGTFPNPAAIVKE
ncbi:hypothetical protein F183_A36940 [Bryobacterales bacterium F-183]|nr:hypothetical protein F183_A36940 [Bryobacterales bacterium F-183]